jgi:hypothetical protein
LLIAQATPSSASQITIGPASGVPVSHSLRDRSVLAYTQTFAAHAEAQQKKGKDAVKGVF